MQFAFTHQTMTESDYLFQRVVCLIHVLVFYSQTSVIWTPKEQIQNQGHYNESDRKIKCKFQVQVVWKVDNTFHLTGLSLRFQVAR